MNDKTQHSIPSNGKELLYRHIVDMILRDVENGQLKPGDRLPNVRELAEKMILSNGTVMHAYNELEQQGVIEKVRGRGTFVRSRDSRGKQGKKDRAMRLIDNLIDEMGKLGFSMKETQIFIDLKIRDREDRQTGVNVLVVDCNPETLYIISNQVAQISGAEVSCKLLNDLPYAYGFMEGETDIIVTTTKHYERVTQAAREEKVSKVELRPSNDTVAKLAKIEESNLVGILTSSERFTQIIHRTQDELLIDHEDMPCMLLGTEKIEKFLSELNTVITPNHYERFCLPGELAALRAFQERGGNIVEFIYHIDAGSLMYLEQEIANLYKKKHGNID